MINKQMLILIAAVVVIGLFAWPAISPDTAPEPLKEFTTVIVGDNEYVAITFEVETSGTPSGLKADVNFIDARWDDTSGLDAFWWIFSTDVKANLEVKYQEKTYTYSKGLTVSTTGKDENRIEFTTGITREMYNEAGAGNICYTLTVVDSNGNIVEPGTLWGTPNNPLVSCFTMG